MNTLEGSSAKGSDQFKYKELKVYSSVEWLSGNKKKYRQVFDRMETDYIYAELSLYNKYFDVDSWDIGISLKCFDARKPSKPICSLTFRKKISKYDNIVFIREGWGNKKTGSFWKGGSYYWESYVDEELIATKYFYVEDSGVRQLNTSNYLNLNKMLFYEGHYDDMTDLDKIYHIKFPEEQVRYIFTELIFDNNIQSRAWHAEFFIRYYNSSGEIKTNISRLQVVKKDESKITVIAGFGSNLKGSWKEGKYRVEVEFMDQILATSYFEIGDDFLEGNPIVYLTENKLLTQPVEGDVIEEDFDELIDHLDRLIGLSDIKSKVKEHALYLKFISLRKEKGFIESDPFDIHCVFMGNPGTGKTTVARMIGKLYYKMGVLTKGHVHEVDRVDLIGEYIGQTAPKVKEAIKKARGGVLFIDEAYSLARTSDDNKDFGREVIEILVKEMSSEKKDLAIIVAGYPKEMKTFIDSNPGLKSRFKHFFDFKDYLPQELIEISEIACDEKEVVLNEQSKVIFNAIIVEAYRNRDKSFGNARYVYDLVEKAKINLGIRIMNRANPNKISHKEMMIIRPKDLASLSPKKTIDWPNIPIDFDLLDSCTQELNAMVGMDEVKKQIFELIEITKYYRKTNKNVLEKFFMHTLFIGNPGTGKTTVARILTKIYKAIGILERGHMVETDRQGLVAGFVGQTAIKTSNKIDDASGGVLFIDEAYALSNASGSRGDFGNEAIQTLLKRMEDDRGKFFVFAAGYPENMEQFLKINPGLKSRFDKILHFPDYSAKELSLIAHKMIKQEGLFLSKQASYLVEEICAQILNYKDKYFGNAREIRKFILEIIKVHDLRVMSSMDDDGKIKANIPIIKEDIQNCNFFSNEDIFKKRQIGF